MFCEHDGGNLVDNIVCVVRALFKVEFFKTQDNANQSRDDIHPTLQQLLVIMIGVISM